MKFYATLLFITLAISACGPEASQMDLERQQNKERLNEKTSENSIVEGEYFGTIQLSEKAFVPVYLSMSNITTVTENGEVDVKRVPRIVSTVILGNTQTLGASNNPAEFTETNPSFVGYAYYFSDSQDITFVVKEQTGITITVPAKYNGSSITGTFFLPKARFVNGKPYVKGQFTMKLNK